MHSPIGLWPCHGQGGNQVFHRAPYLTFFFFLLFCLIFFLLTQFCGVGFYVILPSMLSFKIVLNNFSLVLLCYSLPFFCFLFTMRFIFFYIVYFAVFNFILN